MAHFQTPDVVSAQRFEVRDKHNRVVAVLGADGEFSVGSLKTYTYAGVPLVTITSAPVLLDGSGWASGRVIAHHNQVPGARPIGWDPAGDIQLVGSRGGRVVVSDNYKMLHQWPPPVLEQEEGPAD